MNWHWIVRRAAAGLILAGATALAQTTAPARLPKPQFQSDFFNDMGRAFCTIREVDLKNPALVVRLDKDGSIVRVPIKDDTELHFRDSWGELTDYFPGQHIMLFTYVDEDRKWTYPRAVQDDIHVSARHGWFAAVTAIDLQNHAYATHREEKDKTGKVTKAEDKHYNFDMGVKVWKGAAPTGIEGLKIGDEVIQQLVEKNNQLVAVEILDRAGDDAVRAVQDQQHAKDQDKLGLPAYVSDVEVISGMLMVSVAWSGADRAGKIKPGDVLAITPRDGRTFGAAVSSSERVDTRRRLGLVVNARVAARLEIGQSVRVFMPGTGPEIPDGKSGVPAGAYK